MLLLPVFIGTISMVNILFEFGHWHYQACIIREVEAFELPVVWLFKHGPRGISCSNLLRGLGARGGRLGSFLWRWRGDKLAHFLECLLIVRTEFLLGFELHEWHLLFPQSSRVPIDTLEEWVSLDLIHAKESAESHLRIFLKELTNNIYSIF